MGDVKTTLPSSSPPEHELKPKCKRRKHKHKPRVKIVKEKEFTLYRRPPCTTKKCPLCGKKVDSTELLNCHVMEKHDNYQFLCKFCKCRRSYSSRNSVERHIGHHSPCDTCGKQFHKVYVFEAHKNVHSEKCYICTYPKCDCAYKSAAKYHPMSPRNPEPVVSVINHLKKKYLDEHMKLHSEDLPEECPHCWKKFCWCSSLGIHI